MKTWVEKNFTEGYLNNLNLKDVGISVRVPYNNLKDECQTWFDIDYDELERGYVIVPYPALSQCVIDIFDYEYCEWFDDFEYEETINSLLKDFPSYLVCAYNSNWLGQTGYRFSKTPVQALCRNYDTSMYVLGASKGGKSILISEHSHDVPMGSNTIIIGLTQNELDKLEKSCYNTIIDFADKQMKNIIRF